MIRAMVDTSMRAIRAAGREDVPLILTMIRELAAYEHALDEVRATVEGLEHWLFDEGIGGCLIASLGGEDVGMALYFTSLSTWDGAPGIYLEDLYVREVARGKGLGTALFRELARLVVEKGYTRLDWACLDWNEPSLGFYRSLGAVQRRAWVPHRLELPALKALAN